MQAIILAAGMGKRLKHLTENNTKCMVKVNGVSIIERVLRMLDRKQLTKIIIVVGYEGQKLIDYIFKLGINTPIVYIWNKDYEKTNNIYSLSLTKEYLCEEDTILLESDLIFDESIIDDLLEDKRKSLVVVDKFESWMDGSCIVVDGEDLIKDFVPGKYFDFADREKYYKTVNIYKFSADFSTNIYVPFLCAYEKAMGENEYYEAVIKLIAMLDTNEICAKRIYNQKWYEIDDIQDLDIAESLFEEAPEVRYDRLMSRYGGFWRYPHLIDYCYLVNPYFPSDKLYAEMKSNFENLIMQYPSGQKVDSIIASNVFGIKSEYIVLGNGAAELIKAFLDRQNGRLGIIEPTFNEYKNRYSHEIVTFSPVQQEYRYNSKELIEYFSKQKIDILVLINPDNPSGNYLSMQDIYSILDWTAKKGIKIIIDESFVDFVDLMPEVGIEDITLFNDNILEKYPNLFVIKSISKSYGIPGIRLGVMASSDANEIDSIKKSLSIWNINSFGEFFMQIINKYKKQYVESLEEFRKVRKVFVNELKRINYLRVLPTQANYVMCEVIGRESKSLCVQCFEKDFLIKDLSEKMNDNRQYVRLAIRTREDNDKLVCLLGNLKTGGV